MNRETHIYNLRLCLGREYYFDKPIDQDCSHFVVDIILTTHVVRSNAALNLWAKLNLVKSCNIVECRKENGSTVSQTETRIVSANIPLSCDRSCIYPPRSRLHKADCRHLPRLYCGHAPLLPSFRCRICQLLHYEQ